MLTSTSILTLGLVLTLTTVSFTATAASGSRLASQPPDSNSIYRGSGR